MKCSYPTCAIQDDPVRVEGAKRVLPNGWIQIQITNHVGRTVNFILCRVHKTAEISSLL